MVTLDTEPCVTMAIFLWHQGVPDRSPQYQIALTAHG